MALKKDESAQALELILPAINAQHLPCLVLYGNSLNGDSANLKIAADKNFPLAHYYLSIGSDDGGYHYKVDNEGSHLHYRVLAVNAGMLLPSLSLASKTILPFWDIFTESQKNNLKPQLASIMNTLRIYRSQHSNCSFVYTKLIAKFYTEPFITEDDNHFAILNIQKIILNDPREAYSDIKFFCELSSKLASIEILPEMVTLKYPFSEKTCLLEIVESTPYLQNIYLTDKTLFEINDESTIKNLQYNRQLAQLIQQANHSIERIEKKDDIWSKLDDEFWENVSSLLTHLFNHYGLTTKKGIETTRYLEPIFFKLYEYFIRFNYDNNTYNNFMNHHLILKSRTTTSEIPGLGFSDKFLGIIQAASMDAAIAANQANDSELTLRAIAHGLMTYAFLAMDPMNTKLCFDIKQCILRLLTQLMLCDTLSAEVMDVDTILSHEKWSGLEFELCATLERLHCSSFIIESRIKSVEILFPNLLQSDYRATIKTEKTSEENANLKEQIANLQSLLNHERAARIKSEKRLTAQLDDLRCQFSELKKLVLGKRAVSEPEERPPSKKTKTTDKRVEAEEGSKLKRSSSFF